MSSAGAKRAVVYQDILDLPEHVVGEVIDDELVVSPRPALRHAAAATVLLTELYGAFGRLRGPGPGGWVILFEPELHVVDQILVPDIAAWRRERMPVVPDAAYFDLAPDWICEVLSPSTAARDRTRKMHHYGRAAVPFVWLLDPGPQTLEVFQRDGDAWRLVTSVAGDTVVRAEPFQALELDLGGVWAV